MREVTIEGTETPAAGVLARGKRVTVAYTARIARLISFGYVRIVGGPTPVEPAEPAADLDEVVQPEQSAEQGDQATVDDSVSDGAEVVQPGEDRIASPKAPRSRGTRA
ncbi:hypothetical protein [Mycobacteroides abscessus]|uniref:hypothetical protein n=1 Tax=Mycobacteroides abscessus TaxID=36809 RepID=UPI0002FA5EF0|nr:hypothetical protein [Mycobacteroides abscessus]